MDGLWELTNALSNGTIPDHLRPLLPKDWGFAIPTQNSNRYYLRDGWSYGLQIWQEHSQGPSEQKPVKNFGEKGAWAYPGTAQVFWMPQLSHELVKLRTSNFICVFIASIGTKPIKNFGKSSRGRTQGSRNFLGHPNIGRISRSSLR